MPQTGREQTLPSPNHLPPCPSLDFGGSMATGRGTPLPWHPGALPAVAPLCRGLADTCSPAGEVALPHLDVPPRAWEWLGEGGTAQGWLRRQLGLSRHRKNRRKRGCTWVRIKRPHLELWHEPFAVRTGSFPSFHPLLPIQACSSSPHKSSLTPQITSS